jgi:TRAP transporter TAXI family solute receptor
LRACKDYSQTSRKPEHTGKELEPKGGYQMKLLQKLAPLALAGVMAVTVHAPAVAQQKTTIVPILSCPFGCGVIEMNTILGNAISRGGEPLIVSAQETPGYMYNVQEMSKERRWKNTIFGTEDGIIQLALQGGSPELKEFLPEPIPIRFKLLHGEAYWSQGKYFITTDPNIRTIADMKGKRVSLGLRTQSDWGVFARLILEHGYGITPDNTEIRHMTPASLTQQLIDGTTDVSISAYGTNTEDSYHFISGPLRQLEASGRDLHYIGVDKEAIDKVNKKLGLTFVTREIKAGTLPKQKNDFTMAFVRGYKAVHPNFDEELAYEFVKATHKYAKELRETHPLFNLLTPRMMVDGLTEENAHPGAIRAFKEIGIWDERKETVPVTYPDTK